MKNLKLALFILPLVMLVLSSCEVAQPGKPADGTVITPPAGTVDKSLLVGKNWILTGYTENGVDKLNATYSACELDNVDNFLADGSYIVDEGASKCDAQDSQQEKGTWELSGSKLTLGLADSPIKIEFNISILSSTKLRYSAKNPFDPSQLLDFTFTAN